MPYRTRCIGSALVVLAVVTGGCGSRRGYSAETDRQVLVNEVRVAETLVVGLVFTQLMRDNDIVTATQALCVIESRLGFDGAIEEATVMLRSLDWDAPANRSMLGRMLRLGSTSICEEADTAADTPLTAVLPADRNWTLVRPQPTSMPPLRRSSTPPKGRSSSPPFGA